MDGGLEDVEELLVVDDNPGDLRFIEESFEAAPFDLSVRTTTSAREALDRVTRDDADQDAPAPDLLLLDWNLWRNTGEEVITDAKSANPAMPIVVMTGSKTGLEKLEASIEWADAYLEKQTDPERYVERLRECLSDF